MLQFKLVLLGDSSVGKSSIVQRFVKNSFDENRESTIGAAFLSQTIKIRTDDNTTGVQDNSNNNNNNNNSSSSGSSSNAEGSSGGSEVPIKFEIWDTAGQERYKSLAPMYYRNANAAIVVYDITQKDSLAKAVKWVDELKSKLGEDAGVTISLIGNKVDLVEEAEGERQVAVEEAQEFAAQNSLLFHEVSAKTSSGINEIFQEIGQHLYNLNKEKLGSKNQNTRQNGPGGRGNSANIELNRPSTNDPTSCCS